VGEKGVGRDNFCIKKLKLEIGTEFENEHINMSSTIVMQGMSVLVSENLDMINPQLMLFG
jgi:hypothetical protein